MNYFSIISKPYLTADLWRAVGNLQKCFQDQLEYDEDASNLLRRVRNMARSEQINAFLRKDLDQLFSKLNKPYLSVEEEAALQQLKVITNALMHWPEQTGGTAIWNQSRHFEALLSDSEFKVEVKHPKPESYSVEIKIDPSLRGSCWIARESYWQSFLSNPLEKNVLYLSADYKRNDFIVFVYDNTYRAHYKKISYADEPISFPDALSASQDEHLGVFFQLISVQDFESSGSARTETFYLSAMSDEDIFRTYPTIGWLNPLVLTFNLKDNDISNALESRAQEALEIFTRHDLVIHFQAHLSPLESARWQLFRDFYERQKTQRATKSILEYLFWGEGNEAAWQSFLLLDGLNGTFAIEGFGKYGFQSGQKLQCFWIPPGDLSTNAMWLKDYALSLGTHFKQLDELKDRALIASEMPGFGSARGHKRVKLGFSNQVSIFDILPLLIKHEPYFDLEEAIDLNLLSELLEYALNFLLKIKQLYPAEGLYFGEGSFQVNHDATVRFNDLNFLETFSRTYVSPLSSVLVRLSPIEQENAWVDVVHSVSYGYQQLFAALLSSQIGLFEDLAQVDISYDYGWWQDWFKLLSSKPWNVTINYVSNRGFIINSSLLGQARLGKAAVGKQYSVAEMRI